MFVPILNIVIGLVLVVGGATDKLGILDSQNKVVPMAVGAAVALYGVIQVVREARRPR